MPRRGVPATRRRTASDVLVNPRRRRRSAASDGSRSVHAGIVKVALLAESFLPHMNGVTHSLLQVLRHLERRGHEALVVAPRSGPIDQTLYGARSVLLPSMPLPSYPEVRVTLASTNRLATILRDHDADVVHLASPFVLGWRGVLAAETVDIPSVAVYQTDIPSYAERYGVPGAAPALTRHLGRLHRRAGLTLAPSTSALDRLESLGVERVALWRRGVDTERFAPDRRSDAWRSAVAPNGEIVVGYVGRLAPEKQVEDLGALMDLPGVRVVIVGDGPDRAALERRLPAAHFAGFRGGDDLARAMASFDVFVHPGESETFCQAVQEAMASGVPVVATGAGGPLDLVRSSIDGWLYRPGDLAELRSRVLDLTGDDAKRLAFSVRAREAVAGRGWDVLGDELIDHYERVVDAHPGTRGTRVGRMNRTSVARTTTGGRAADAAASVSTAPPRWRRYVAVGDSLTEGLCDTSRALDGQYRGWADRLAMLLALTTPAVEQVGYANLAVRSRRVDDAVTAQLPRAIELGADLVTVLIGANDLVGRRDEPDALADRLATAVMTLRATGCDVLLVTPFLPRRPASRLFAARFDRFNERLRVLAAQTGSMLLDVDAMPELVGGDRWAEDRVHLNPAGHRGLAYAAARVLGVPDAQALGALERAAHEVDEVGEERAVGDLAWLRRHAAPWIARRLQGRTAGDGLNAKRPELLPFVVDVEPGSPPPRTHQQSGRRLKTARK
jgi:phosphatidylinositol alpha 1,6-mannosyltransferase